MNPLLIEFLKRQTYGEEMENCSVTCGLLRGGLNWDIRCPDGQMDRCAALAMNIFASSYSTFFFIAVFILKDYSNLSK